MGKSTMTRPDLDRYEALLARCDGIWWQEYRAAMRELIDYVRELERSLARRELTAESQRSGETD
jgi:hypothetical protein